MSLQAPDFEFTTYRYEPLPTPSSIRLLSVAPQRENGPTVGGTPLIYCTLKTVDLDTAPEFKALSYTWGNPFTTDPDPKKDQYDSRHQWPLSVNGRVHFVTKNLYEALQQLFLHGIPFRDQRYPGFDKTTMIRAAESNDPDRVLRCLQLGADMHMQDVNGETALHYAAENGHPQIVKTLLRYGANDKIRNRRGLTPLESSMKRKRGQHQQVVQALRTAAPIEKRRREKPTSTELLDDEVCDLWIDAVSINQCDIEERTAQVALMSRIYSTAKSVLVWLGREDTSTQNAAKALQGHSISDFQMRDVRNLITRSWFTRKWVIQEFCLAKTIEMMCGAFQIVPDRLLKYDLVHLLPGLGVSALPATRLQQGTKGLGIWDVLTLRRWFEQIQTDRTSHLTPPSLPALIVLTWHFKSIDARDIIFSLLGIVKMYPAEGSPCDIVADYSKSIEEVFLEAGRLFVEAPGRNEIPHWNKNPELLELLEGLSFVQHEEGRHLRNLPSWVPNFHLALRTVRLWDRRFWASGQDLTSTIWPSDPGVLKLNGHLIDRVTQTEHINGAQKTNHSVSAPDPSAWFRLALSLPVYYQDDSELSRVEVLWRTLIADDIGDTQPRIARETFKEFVCEHMKKSGEHTRQMLEKLRATDDSQSLPSLEEIDQFIVPKKDTKTSYRVAEQVFHAGFKKYYPQRQLFRTEAGYLGLGPLSLAAGDEVWIINGARTPFILRPVADEGIKVAFELVGECYIHGVMNGEAASDRETASDPIEIQ